MDSIVITWRELLIVAVIVLAIYVVEAVLVLRRGNGKGLRLWRLGAQAHAEHFAVGALREEINALRLQVVELRAEIERLSGNTLAAPTPYAQAIQLVRGGGRASDVAARCGISRGEAELIVALYQKR